MVKLPRGERLKSWWKKVPKPKEVLIDRPKEAIKRKLWSMIPVQQIIAYSIGGLAVVLVISAMLNGCVNRLMTPRPSTASPVVDVQPKEYRVACSGCGTVYICQKPDPFTDCPNCPLKE